MVTSPQISLPYYGSALPTIEQIAEQLIQDAEFRTLQLGGILNTPTGEFIEESVALAIPRLFSPEFELLVGALRLASENQRNEARGNALLAAGGSLLVGLILRSLIKAA